jgi:Uma2 family endonuclease
MPEATPRPMTLDEFLRWDDGTDTRFELIGGFPVPRPIQPEAHGMLLARLCAEIQGSLDSRSDYFGQVIAAVAIPHKPATCYLADLVVTPYPVRPTAQLVRDPVVIAEISSPSTVVCDREIKIPDYRRLPSVQEILVIDCERVCVERHRHQRDVWITDFVRGTGTVLRLGSLGVELPLSNLYGGVAFSAQDAG